MEKGDKRSTMMRMGVSGWMFLLVPAYPGCPGSKAVKRSSLLLLLYPYPLKTIRIRILSVVLLWYNMTPWVTHIVRHRCFHLSTYLKVESQCNEACLKANRMLGLIKRTFVVKTPEVMLNLYKTLVRPHLNIAYLLGLHITKRIKSSLRKCSTDSLEW